MKGSPGLSLMEMLVALALMALIAAGLGAGLQLMIRVTERVDALEAGAGPLAHRALLRRWLVQATPPARLTPFGPAFDGGADGLTALTLAPTAFAPEAAALRLSLARDGARLLARAETLDDDAEILATREMLLAEGVVALRLSYYDARAEPPGWRPDWRGATRLPDLIRIEVDGASDPPWPALILRPELGR